MPVMGVSCKCGKVSIKDGVVMMEMQTVEHNGGAVGVGCNIRQKELCILEQYKK